MLALFKDHLKIVVPDCEMYSNRNSFSSAQPSPHDRGTHEHQTITSVVETHLCPQVEIKLKEQLTLWKQSRVCWGRRCGTRPRATWPRATPARSGAVGFDTNQNCLQSCDPRRVRTPARCGSVTVARRSRRRRRGALGDAGEAPSQTHFPTRARIGKIEHPSHMSARQPVEYPRTSLPALLSKFGKSSE